MICETKHKQNCEGRGGGGGSNSVNQDSHTRASHVAFTKLINHSLEIPHIVAKNPIAL